MPFHLVYPDYYTKSRPKPTALPTSLSYGGAFFDVNLTASDVGDKSHLQNTLVSVVRTGYSTHAMNMGQRYLQLNNTYTMNSDGSATLHVSQMPPCVACFPPGPAFIFVVVNGVPSNGAMVMIGSGTIGTQTTSSAATLPGTLATWDPTASSNAPTSKTNVKKSHSSRVSPPGLLSALFTFLFGFMGLVLTPLL